MNEKISNQEIIVIAAVAKDYTISKNNIIPWNIPQDLKRFKEITTNYPIIMGRTTFETLPKGPLKNRINCILTKNKEYSNFLNNKYPDFFPSTL